MTCVTCNKPLAKERAALVFESVPGKIGWCEEHMHSEEATKVLAGLAERRRVDLW